MKLLKYFFLVASLISLAACSKSDSEAITPDNTTPIEGYVSGRVVDWQKNSLLRHRSGRYSRWPLSGAAPPRSQTHAHR